MAFLGTLHCDFLCRSVLDNQSIPQCHDIDDVECEDIENISYTSGSITMAQRQWCSYNLTRETTLTNICKEDTITQYELVCTVCSKDYINPRWAPRCWPHESCYQGWLFNYTQKRIGMHILSRNFNGGLTKPPLKLRHACAFPFHPIIWSVITSSWPDLRWVMFATESQG